MTLLGSQDPTLRLVPECVGSEGYLAIEFARQIGYTLFPYQERLLVDGLSLDANRRLVAQSVIVVLSRQNGKSEVLEVLVLYGLFVARFRTVLYTAHQLASVQGFFRRIRERIRRSPLLQGALKPGRSGVKTGNGHWELHLKTGQEAHFRTRTKDGGRGLDAVPLLIIDEVQNYDDTEQAAVEAITSSASNPQKWYAGSAGGQHSTVMGRLVRQAEAGVAGIVYHGWHASEDDDPKAPETWAKTNPGLGAILEVATVEGEAGQWSPHYFARERLGIGDYPRPPGEEWVIPRTMWNERLDLESTPAGLVVFAPDCSYDLHWGSVGVGGRRQDGDIHLEVVEHDRGVAWLAPKVAELVSRHKTYGVAVSTAAGASGRVLAELANMRTEGRFKAKIVEFDAGLDKQVFTWSYSSAMAPPRPGSQHGNPSFRHRGSELLTGSLSAAGVRRVGNAQAWARVAKADIGPLHAAFTAGYGVLQFEQQKRSPALSPGLAAAPGVRDEFSAPADDVMGLRF